MLDAYVIEEIKRREREQRHEDRPTVELPLPSYPDEGPRGHDDHDRGPGDRDRGVVIIDYSG